MNVTTNDGLIDWSRLSRLASLELVFHLSVTSNSKMQPHEISNELSQRKVAPPKSFSISSLSNLSIRQQFAAVRNIDLACS
mmetsp:Transcript_8720/g.15172  ORF Transcript_8720/g.15172 Transcript_8720/m.15172 type:complete len:81 (-) Transcript_8720:152-394(-)